MAMKQRQKTYIVTLWPLSSTKKEEKEVHIVIGCDVQKDEAMADSDVSLLHIIGVDGTSVFAIPVHRVISVKTTKIKGTVNE